MTHNRPTGYRGRALPARRSFQDSEELRCLLRRLHAQGDGAWTHDPIAAELMRYARDKYAALPASTSTIRGRRSRRPFK